MGRREKVDSGHYLERKIKGQKKRYRKIDRYIDK